MDEKQFKKNNKPPACTQNPIFYIIPAKIRKEVLRQIKNECLDIYSKDISSECSKRLICHTKACIGRELPWKSPTALPYLKEFAKRVGIKEGDEYFIETDCNKCPIVNVCTKPCMQIVDNVNKHKQVLEPILYFKDNIDSYANIYEIDNSTSREIVELSIPWDAISEKKAQIVKEYLYNQRDFKAVADKYKLTNQARCKYEYYSALNKLSEVAIMRQFLEKHSEKLTPNQLLILSEVYGNNKSITQVAKELGITKQSCQQTVGRVIKAFNIKWQNFVRKHKGRVIYNVPEVLK